MSVSIPSNTLEKFTTFGDLLRFLRRRVGLTQTELAIAVGYGHTQISRLEQNLRLPDIPTIQARFIAALGLEEEPKVVARLLDLAANIRREDAPALGLCPYRGLNYFEEADADLFVGREALAAKLVERVISTASNRELHEERFLAIVGASGSGKSSLARAMPGILPEMSIDESLDVTRIYSVADQLPAGTPLIRHRPFRAPHHTISHAGLVGGGTIPKPGEISLAHRGVLFLDEFPEFGTRVLEVMRQPMEDKVVTISRAKGSLTFSANFQLIAAMNPCPCGFYGDSQKPCTCAHALVTKYQKRISGPLLDRIDIHIEVPRVDYEKLSGDRMGEPSECIRARVQAARDRQSKRFGSNGSSDIVCSADMRVGEIRPFCKLPEEGQSLMRAAMTQLNLSARAYHRTRSVKLARTIADLAGCEEIQPVHLAEALQYRPKLLLG